MTKKLEEAVAMAIFSVYGRRFLVLEKQEDNVFSLCCDFAKAAIEAYEKAKGGEGMSKDSLTELANSLSPEQYLKLVEFAYGPIPKEIKDMTDDEIIAELRG